MSWAPALILTAGLFLLLSIGAALIRAWWDRYTKQQRRNKRLYGHGNVYSMRDFHD